MRNKLLIEALGTFFLCLAAGLAQGPVGPIAVGAVLLAVIYAGGFVSGAHYNPAVSLAVCVRGRQSWSAGLAYVGAQLGAALAAALVVGLMHGHTEENSQHILEALKSPMLDGWIPILCAEALGTFLLAFVILMVATSRQTVGNSYYGLAIAATVVGLASIFSQVGATFNPAVELSTSVSGLFSAANTEGSAARAFASEFSLLAHSTPQILLSLLAQCAGGAAAGWAFLGLFPEDR
jgi:aquaporin Z